MAQITRNERSRRQQELLANRVIDGIEKSLAENQPDLAKDRSMLILLLKARRVLESIRKERHREEASREKDSE